MTRRVPALENLQVHCSKGALALNILRQPQRGDNLDLRSCPFLPRNQFGNRRSLLRSFSVFCVTKPQSLLPLLFAEQVGKRILSDTFCLRPLAVETFQCPSCSILPFAFQKCFFCRTELGTLFGEKGARLTFRTKEIAENEADLRIVET